MRKINNTIELSYNDLILAGINYLSGKRRKIEDKIIIPKLPLGLLNHEADLISIDNPGFLTEFVIKMSLESFKMEFLKDFFYDDDERVYYLAFIVPHTIKDECAAFMEKFFKQYGMVKHPYTILPCNEDGVITEKKKRYGLSKSNNPKRRLLTFEEKYNFAHYGNGRYSDALRRRKEVF